MAKKETPAPDFGQSIAELRSLAHEHRAKVSELQQQIQKRLELAGNLEGAIITANETHRSDPARALEQIRRAKSLLVH